MSRYYRSPDWVEEYYRELWNSNRMKWHSYVYWGREAFSGKYINVDESGRRLTWKGRSMEGKIPGSIFFFGGSAMWGDGSRDDYTIPSLVAKRLSASPSRPPNLPLVNYGESGHVMFQEMVGLMDELRRGRIPRFVIFYDGFNDVLSAFQQRAVGWPLNESHREKEFNLLHRERRSSLFYFCAKNFLFDGLEGYRALAIQAGVWGRSKSLLPSPVKTDSLDKSAADRLADELVERYISQVQLVSRLGRQFGFQALFYWQPTLFSKRHMTNLERIGLESQKGLGEFYQTVSQKLAMNSERLREFRFRNLGDVFADERRSIFLDCVHITEEGNDVIADKFHKDLLPLFIRQ